jgi:hypothetical protein
MSAADRIEKYYNIRSLEDTITREATYNNPITYDYETARVMREETELILNKQRTIFHILTVSTLVTLIITFSI